MPYKQCTQNKRMLKTHKKHETQCGQPSRTTEMTLEQLQNYLGTLT
jgi:hypothetical protein